MASHDDRFRHFVLPSTPSPSPASFIRRDSFASLSAASSMTHYSNPSTPSDHGVASYDRYCSFNLTPETGDGSQLAEDFFGYHASRSKPKTRYQGACLTYDDDDDDGILDSPYHNFNTSARPCYMVLPSRDADDFDAKISTFSEFDGVEPFPTSSSATSFDSATQLGWQMVGGSGSSQPMSNQQMYLRYNVPTLSSNDGGRSDLLPSRLLSQATAQVPRDLDTVAPADTVGHPKLPDRSLPHSAAFDSSRFDEDGSAFWNMVDHVRFSQPAEDMDASWDVVERVQSPRSSNAQPPHISMGLRKVQAARKRRLRSSDRAAGLSIRSLGRVSSFQELPSNKEECEICGSKFARAEHLKRHKRKHGVDLEIRKCALALYGGHGTCTVNKDTNTRREGAEGAEGAKKKRKGIDREDNLHQHYVTHLNRKKTDRNKIVDKDFLYFLIRKHDDNAEKIIRCLEKAYGKAKFSGFGAPNVDFQTNHPEWTEYLASQYPDSSFISAKL